MSKTYDRINISSQCDKLKTTYLPGQIANLIEFMDKKTFVCTFYEACLSDEWKVGNGVCQGGITSGIFFNFYLNEVSTDLDDLSLRCKLDDVRVYIFCYADDIALLSPTEKALQFMLDTLAPKIENLSLKINVEKSCNIVFEHKSRRNPTNWLLQDHPLKNVSKCVYVGVVLKDNLARTSDMERSKRTFFKQHISTYQNFSYVDTNIMLYLFRMHAMSFYGIETLFKKLHKKVLNNIPVVYHKAIKRNCGRNSYDSNHECLEYAHLPIFKHYLAKNFICYALRLIRSISPCLMTHKHYLKYIGDNFGGYYSIASTKTSP